MGKIFKRGLIALAPVAISLAIIIWLFGTLEDIFRVPLEWIVGKKFYFPGMGLAVAFVFIFFVGILVNNFVIQKFSSWVDRLFAKIPLFKTLYTSIADMMSYLKPKDPEKKGLMVVVEFDGMKFLAIQTRDDFSDFPADVAGDDYVAVYIPLSYQIGGVMATIPRSKVRPVDMSVEQGMRFIVSAGMVSGKNHKVPPPVG